MNIIQITDTGAIKVWHEKFPSEPFDMKGTVLSAPGDVLEFFRGRVSVVSDEGNGVVAIVNGQIIFAIKTGARLEEVVKALVDLLAHYRLRLDEMLAPRPGYDLDA